MITATITLTDNASPAVGRVNRYIKSKGARQLVAYTGAKILRDHFGVLEATRANKDGFPRQHYWSDARKAVYFNVDGDNAVVAVKASEVPGVKLHYYGGTVSAGRNVSFLSGEPTKYLTIPASGQAYGKRASEFDQLVLVCGLGGKPYALALPVTKEKMDQYGAVSVTTTAGQIMYWLKESVTLQPDPSVLPEPYFMAGRIASRLGKEINRRWKGDFNVEVGDEFQPDEEDFAI
jgi:hypothetical protein